MNNNNNNNKLHFLNFTSGILLFLASIYGFMDTPEKVHFTNLVVNVYTFFVGFGVVFVAIAGYRGQHPPDILESFEDHSTQLKFLFLYSWLTIGLSFTSRVMGSLVLVYSFVGLIYIKLKPHSLQGDTNSVV